MALKNKKSEILWISPKELQVEEGFNVRYDYGNIEELSNSIVENGVKVPLRVYEKKDSGEKVIIDGHRRFKAIQKLLKDGYDDFLVPVIVEQNAANEEERVLGMIIYNEGKTLTMLEEAEVYRRLKNFGWSPSEISRRVGKSITHINNCFVLLGASKKIQQQVKDNKISASSVIEALKKGEDTKEVEDNISKTIAQNKGKKVTSKHITRNSESRANKFTLENLKSIHENMENIVEGDRIEEAFDTLEAIIKWGEGRITNTELSLAFFKQGENE